MREILFRGKRERDGKWLYGLLVPSRTNYGDENIEIVQRIEYETDLEYSTFVDGEKVNMETIGQFTGLCDKNGKKIFEGDIYHQGDKNIRYVVEYTDDCHFMGKQIGSSSWAGLHYFQNYIEVIGNIHDNPELLKGE